VLQQQLRATLQGLPGVGAVQVTIAGGDLPDVAVPDPADSAVDASPVVLDGGELARLSAGALQRVPDVAPLAGTPVSDPAVLGQQYAVLAHGRTQLLRLQQGRSAPPVVALTGTDLTAPSLDRYGWAWSTSAACGGAVSVAGRDGQDGQAGPVAWVAAPWLAGRRVVSLRVARDGARVVVASTGAPGAPARVDVASVVRADDGTPQALAADAAEPTPWLADVRAAAWVDGDSVAVLGTAAAGTAEAGADQGGAAPSVWTVAGGRTTWVGSPEPEAEPVRLAAGAGLRALVVATTDGRLWQRAGSRWVPTQTAGSDPAFAG
jgi:hypothetical protein